MGRLGKHNFLKEIIMTTIRKVNKEIVYLIEARLAFDIEDNIDVQEYLDKLREIGEAEIVDVEIVNRRDT